MKKLAIILLLFFKFSLIFSQNFNDKIFTSAGNIIKCHITSITNICIFYNLTTDKNNDFNYIFFSDVKDYELDKASKPKIELKHCSGNKIMPANKEGLYALEKSLDSIAAIPFKFTDSYAINVEAFYVRDIKFTYTHRLFNRSYLETMLSYNIPYYTNEGGNKDPYNYYGRIQLRLGLKNYYKRRSYVSPMLLFGYGHFSNGWVNDRGIIDDRLQNDWLVTRNKIESEILLKLGGTLHHKHIMHDIYYGLGFRYNIMYDNIHEEEYWANNMNNCVYPSGLAAKRTLYYVMIEFHLGYQIGYCK